MVFILQILLRLTLSLLPIAHVIAPQAGWVISVVLASESGPRRSMSAASGYFDYTPIPAERQALPCCLCKWTKRGRVEA